VGLKMRKKGHCDDHPYCDSYHARDKYKRRETCDDRETNRGRPKPIDESEAPWNRKAYIVM
jgi:hypothetical protein